MQCPSCKFENMPGSAACGRCGAQLSLAAVAIDVHPPRAGRWEKRMVRWYRVIGPAYALRNVLSQLQKRLELDVPAGALWRLVCPGWPQLYLGRKRLGQGLLYGYLALLAIGLLFAGTTVGAVALGLAIAAHVSTVMDVAFSGTRQPESRVLYSLLGCVILGVALYLPAGWAISRVASPQLLLMAAPPFQAGDVLVYNPSAYYGAAPQVGDVVVYDVTPRNLPAGYHRTYQLQGRRIDRIVASPGQTVEWKEGRIWIDGQPSVWLPLNPGRIPQGIKVQVRSGCYLIFPSTDPLLETATFSGAEWADAAQVPAGSIFGRVYWQLQPLWRFGRIR